MARRWKSFLTVFAAAPCLLAAPAAQAQFADPPPGEHAFVAEPGEDDPAPFALDPPSFRPRSTVRLHLGPALRIDGEAADGGIFAAVDVGSGAAGARFSGAWVQVGSHRGLGQYAGELWLDFAHEGRLHPILGAGAGVARVEREDPATGDVDATTAGIGVLRGALEYSLPVRGTDARASIELVGTLPAVRSSDAPALDPWLLALATVSVGF